MDDMDQENLEVDLKPQFFIDEYEQYSWRKLMDKKLSGQERFNLYEEATKKLTYAKHIPELFRTIFENARLPYNDPRVLTLFLKEINGFSYEHSEELGNSFEYLLSILGSQGDAGQFRTPRHIIDFIAEVVDPKKNETILDPACGTAGFLISAYKHICKDHDGLDNKTGKPTNKEKNLTPEEKTKIMNNIVGYDISPDMVKLSLVNMYLHGFQNPQIYKYDTLTSEKRWDEQFDVIIANPPFMTPKGGIQPHKRFSIQANRAEVLFVDYIMEHLSINGRAGIIVPEGIIFKGDKAYKALRKKLVEDGLFAVVSLPSGVFQPYSGVKTSILFFDNQIAKKTNEILFIKVLNDGFDLGVQRRPRPDLPNDLFDKGGALDVLRAQSIAIQTGNKNTLVNDKSLFAWVVEKEEIAESGDCNLTGDKYKRDLYVRLQSITQNLEKIFKPYKETLKQIQKQTEPYRKLTEQLQKQAEQVSRVFASLMFQEAQKSIQKVVEQMQKAFKNVDFQQIIKQQKKLQEELKKRQKWGMVKLEEILEYEQPTKYIVESVNYNDSFKTPVLTAGKTFILGYTNEREGIMPANKLPVIIFDDFTTAIKFVDFPFKVKSSAMKILHIDQKKADPRFLFQLMKTIKFRHDDHKRYWISEFSKIKIPLPPLEVQKEIAEQIEVKQNAINHAKEIIKNLERERRYFSQEIGKLEDIELVELGEVCEIQSGGTPKRNEKKYWNGYIPWLGSAVCKDKKVYEAKEFITEEGLNNSSTRLFKINTTLLALVGATIGKTALLKLEASTNQNIAGLYPKNENQLDPIYLFLAVQSQYQKFLDLGDGKFKMANLSFVKKLKIPLPPLEIQKQLVIETEKEEEIITANKNLIEIMEKKIEKVIEEI